MTAHTLGLVLMLASAIALGWIACHITEGLLTRQPTGRHHPGAPRRYQQAAAEAETIVIGPVDVTSGEDWARQLREQLAAEPVTLPEFEAQEAEWFHRMLAVATGQRELVGSEQR